MDAVRWDFDTRGHIDRLRVLPKRRILDFLSSITIDWSVVIIGDRRRRSCRYLSFRNTRKRFGMGPS